MPDLDQRVVDGLRELVDRAPIDADVWPATERYVTKHRQRRRARVSAVVVAALIVGFALSAAVVRGGDAKVVVAGPSASTETTSPGSNGSALGPSGPIEGSFTITAAPAPANALTFAPSAVTVDTGIYAVTLADGGDAAHTLSFDDPSTLWSPLMVNSQGETKTTRIFFGEPGTYAFYCAIPGHRAAGMRGVVTVTGPSMTLAQAESAGTSSNGS